MSQSTEDYLDSLLRQAIGIEEPKPIVEEEPIVEQVANEDLQPISDAIEDIVIDEPVIEKPIIEEPVEEIQQVSIDDLDPADANKALDPDMIAALFASANAEDSVVPAESEAIEDGITDEISEEVTNEEPSIEETVEDIQQVSIDDLDPADANKALDPDMIAALFASANADDSVAPAESETAEDSVTEEIADEVSTEEPIIEESATTESTEDTMEAEDLDALLSELDNLDAAISKEENNDSVDLELNGMDLGDVDLGAMLDDVTKSVDEERLANTDEISAEDLNALLNSLDEDEDISDIGDMLKKDENSEILDAASMNALLNDSEDFTLDLGSEVDEDDKKKKKKKKEKKPRKKLFGKKDKEIIDDFAGLGADGEEVALEIDFDSLPDASEKKKGFFSRVVEKLFEEDEEEQPAEQAKPSSIEESAVDIAAEGAEANEEILKQLEEEPEEDKKKKKKGKKKKGDDDGDGEESPKKKKKEKKVKDEEPEIPPKKLPMKKVLANIGLCLSLAAVFIIIAYFYPYAHDKQMAKKHFATGEYKEVYEYLRGRNLNEEEQLMYEKAFTVLKVDRQFESYENYMKMGNHKLEALNALVQGVEVMDEYSDKAQNLGVWDRFSASCEKIINELNSVFGVSVDEAREWYQMEGTSEYTMTLYNHLYYMMPRDAEGNLIYIPDEANKEIMTVEEADQ